MGGKTGTVTRAAPPPVRSLIRADSNRKTACPYFGAVRYTGVPVFAQAQTVGLCGVPLPLHSSPALGTSPSNPSRIYLPLLVLFLRSDTNRTTAAAAIRINTQPYNTPIIKCAKIVTPPFKASSAVLKNEGTFSFTSDI